MKDVMTLHTDTVRISAKVAKMFRTEFYVNRRSQVLKPNYYFNRNEYWNDVLAFFARHGLTWSQQQYYMLCGWDMKTTQIIVWNGRTCQEGLYRIVKNDTCIMTRELVDGILETKFYHIMSSLSHFLGFREHVSVRGCIVINEDDAYLCQARKCDGITKRDIDSVHQTESLVDRFVNRLFNIKNN